MDCREMKTMMDSYISDELLVETNHDVLRHLENCRDCRGEMADRRALKLRVRHTVVNATETEVDPVFASRLTRELRDHALRPGLWDRVVQSGRLGFPRLAYAGLGIVAIGIVIGMFMLRGPSENQVSQGNNAINAQRDAVIEANSRRGDAVQAAWNELADHAVGDHENCAVKFNLKEKPITLDEAAKRYGAFNKDLDKVITTALHAEKGEQGAGETQFLESHFCLYEGRRFAHIVFKHKGRMVSFLVAETDLPATNDDIQTASFDGKMSASGFRVGHHAVFVVSELPDTENVSLARSVVPAIRLHAGKLGA
ncbi:MAG: zf-HC2 domain-containing protein [Pyrinomonadaceae bacterium]